MLRNATLDDLMTVATWIKTARECVLWAGGQVSFPIDLATLPEAIRFDERSAYVWVVGDEAAAFGRLVTKVAGRWHLATIIVCPAARRQGHGEAFIRAMMVRAIDAKCRCVSLNVHADNLAALALYLRLGFADAARPADEPVFVGSRYMERA